MCGTQVSIFGLLANDPATVSPIGYHGHNAVLCNPNRFIFGDNIIFGINGVIVLGCKVSLISAPPPSEVCLLEGDNYSMILPLF